MEDAIRFNVGRDYEHWDSFQWNTRLQLSVGASTKASGAFYEKWLNVENLLISFKTIATFIMDLRKNGIFYSII